MEDELRYWGGKILKTLSYPEDDPVYSTITCAMKHPDEIGVDASELTVLANAQFEDGELEQMVEEFYELLHQIAEENEKKG